MSIDLQIYLIVSGIVFCSIVAAYQSFRLHYIYKSKSSWIGVLTFLLFGAKQLYGLIRLHENIAQARSKGVMILHLSLEQWLVGVIWSYAIVIGFIVWQHWQRRDLQKLGIVF